MQGYWTSRVICKQKTALLKKKEVVKLGIFLKNIYFLFLTYRARGSRWKLEQKRVHLCLQELELMNGLNR